MRADEVDSFKPFELLLCQADARHTYDSVPAVPILAGGGNEAHSSG